MGHDYIYSDEMLSINNLITVTFSLSCVYKYSTFYKGQNNLSFRCFLNHTINTDTLINFVGSLKDSADNSLFLDDSRVVGL